MKILQTLLFGLVAFNLNSAYAALPQSGLWMINNEINGQPGRGIHIDRQEGRKVILTYYGYRPNGSATFYLAVGDVDENSTLKTNLIEYKNGPVIGEAVKNGEIERIVGPIEISFQTSTDGLLKLPNEEPKNFSRFVYENHLNRLNSSFAHVTSSLNKYSKFSPSTRLKIAATENSLTIEQSESGGQICMYIGNLKAQGGGYSSEGKATCSYMGSASPEAFYKIEELTVDELGFLSANLFVSDLPDFPNPSIRRIYGACTKYDGGIVPSITGPERCELP